jgi:hypothetical protein
VKYIIPSVSIYTMHEHVQQTNNQINEFGITCSL